MFTGDPLLSHVRKPRGTARKSARDHGCCFNFHLGAILNQRHDLYQRHGWVMPPDHRLVDTAKFLERGEVVALVGDVPCQANEVFGARACTGDSAPLREVIVTLAVGFISR